jgi:hypothetical protein
LGTVEAVDLAGAAYIVVWRAICCFEKTKPFSFWRAGQAGGKFFVLIAFEGFGGLGELAAGLMLDVCQLPTSITDLDHRNSTDGDGIDGWRGIAC